MHREALDWVNSVHNNIDSSGKDLKILEFGSLNINGSVRSILEPISSYYVGVDVQDGPGVDIVCDAVSYDTDILFDIVVCCEVFEHTPDWKLIIENSFRLLKDGGLFIATMAGEGRMPHSAIDENPIRDWEHYANIGEWELGKKISSLSSKYETNYIPFDLRCWAIK